MSSPSTEGRLRLKAVRLSEVPKTVRLRALDVLLETEGSKDGMLVASSSLTERLQLGFAAEQPSDRVYWVSSAAWEKATRRREWKAAP